MSIIDDILAMGTPPASHGVPVRSTENGIEGISTRYYFRGEFCEPLWCFHGDMGWLSVRLKPPYLLTEYAPRDTRGVLLLMREHGWTIPRELIEKYTK